MINKVFKIGGKKMGIYYDIECKNCKESLHIKNEKKIKHLTEFQSNVDSTRITVFNLQKYQRS